MTYLDVLNSNSIGQTEENVDSLELCNSLEAIVSRIKSDTLPLC